MAQARYGGLINGTYINASVSVAHGTTDQEVDVNDLLTAAGRGSAVGNKARYCKITTDVDLLVRFNSTSADQVSVPSGTTGLTIPADAGLIIDALYLSYAGTCGTSTATVTVFAI